MTAPVVDAGFLAPIVARVDAIERAVAILREIAERQSADVARIVAELDATMDDVRELRAAVRGES